MYTNDKITHKDEIKEEGVFSTNMPFYVFLVPKNELANAVAIIDTKLCHDDNFGPFPFVPNEWNPASVSSLNVTPTILQNYQIFIGGEL